MVMRSFLLFILALLPLIGAPFPASAQGQAASRVVAVESWVEEWDEASQSWIRITDPVVEYPQKASRSERLAVPQPLRSGRFANPAVSSEAVLPAPANDDAAQFGPFQVIDRNRAALVGVTDTFSPHHFANLLRAHPEISVLEMIEAPGTRDDIANLKLGRMIRDKGITTHVPHNGSVRSGAVELFLAGAERQVSEGAQFAVHSWMDSYGRQPEDFAADAPENRLYLDYYQEMGMSEQRAEKFYAMTNSVPHQDALWLDAGDMREWIAPEDRKARELPLLDSHSSDATPRLAYLDVTRIEVSPLAFDEVVQPEVEIASVELASLDSQSSFY